MKNQIAANVESSVRSKPKVKRALFYAVFISFPVLHYLVFYVFINFNSFLMAFRTYTLDPLKGMIYEFAGWKNFGDAWQLLVKSGDRIWMSVLFLAISLFFSTPLALLFSYYIYKKRLDKANEKLKKEQEGIVKKMQEKELKVQGLSKQVLSIREGILENTETYKKIMQNACSVEEAKKNEDWLSLYGSLKITYPFFMDGLEQQLPGLTEEERHFCCLLKLGLDNQQLAIFLDIQSTSVDRRRYRIRKKGKFENTQTTLEELIAAL